MSRTTALHNKLIDVLYFELDRGLSVGLRDGFYAELRDGLTGGICNTLPDVLYDAIKASLLTKRGNRS